MSKTTCQNDAEYRYTWPGRDEALICGEHANGLRAVSNAMGLPLQMIPVNEGKCEQQVSS